MHRTRALILGAAGRDFHDFNMLYRNDPLHEVVGFTAQQIPHIADRRYPPQLSGALYPAGIPIFHEERLEVLVAELGVGVCVMPYSDVSHEDVMHLASRANAAGADFALIAPVRTMLPTRLPTVAVCATRTGAGKSQTSRAIVPVLRAAGAAVAVLRHPMPYGDLRAQRVQRFADEADLRRHRVTIEEREEYASRPAGNGGAGGSISGSPLRPRSPENVTAALSTAIRMDAAPRIWPVRPRTAASSARSTLTEHEEIDRAVALRRSHGVAKRRRPARRVPVSLANQPDFDWRLIGARRGTCTIDGEKRDGVWHAGLFYMPAEGLSAARSPLRRDQRLFEHLWLTLRKLEESSSHLGRLPGATLPCADRRHARPQQVREDGL